YPDLRAMFRAVISRAGRASAAAAAAPRSAIRPALAPAPRAWRFYSDEATPEKSKQEAPKQEAPEGETAKAVSVEDFRKMEKALVEKDAKIKELKDAYLRSLADAENIRNRSKTEIENTKAFAIQKFAKDLLDTVDILELALKHVPKEALADKVANKPLIDLHSGVDMTMASMIRTMERYGVESFDPLDKPYDPNTSHALFQAPMPGKTPGHVFVVEKRGYTIKGRVVRPAQVGVVVDPSGN
ncbi:GrpE, mitochondrial, partial [Coemansia biformis]